MEEEKVTKQVEETQSKKPPKTFSILQTILLFILTIALTSGGGYALGHFYFWNDIDMKRVNEQLEFYQERVRVDPGNLEYRIILGYTHFLKGNNNDAIREFMFVLSEDEGYYDAHYNLGLVYLNQNRYNEALSSFNRTIQIAPRDFKGYVQMGIAYRGLGMYEEALEVLYTANELARTNSDIIYQIGRVAEAMGDYELAVEIYKDSLQFDPLFQPAAEGLDRLSKYDTGTVGD